MCEVWDVPKIIKYIKDTALRCLSQTLPASCSVRGCWWRCASWWTFLNGGCEDDGGCLHSVGFWVMAVASQLVSLLPLRSIFYCCAHSFSTQQTWLGSCHSLLRILPWFPFALGMISPLFSHAYESAYLVLASFSDLIFYYSPFPHCTQTQGVLLVSPDHPVSPSRKVGSALTFWGSSSLTSFPNIGW